MTLFLILRANSMLGLPSVAYVRSKSKLLTLNDYNAAVFSAVHNGTDLTLTTCNSHPQISVWLIDIFLVFI